MVLNYNSFIGSKSTKRAICRRKDICGKINNNLREMEDNIEIDNKNLDCYQLDQ